MSEKPPPPWSVPSPSPADPSPERRGPGFIVCGIAVVGGLFVLGGIASVVGSLFGDAQPAYGAVFLLAVAAAVYMSIRNPRFARCLFKGLATTAVLLVVLVGACFALLARSGV
jgi:hypothetical protein